MVVMGTCRQGATLLMTALGAVQAGEPLLCHRAVRRLQGRRGCWSGDPLHRPGRAERRQAGQRLWLIPL